MIKITLHEPSCAKVLPRTGISLSVFLRNRGRIVEDFRRLETEALVEVG